MKCPICDIELEVDSEGNTFCPQCYTIFKEEELN